MKAKLVKITRKYLTANNVVTNGSVSRGILCLCLQKQVIYV